MRYPPLTGVISLIIYMKYFYYLFFLTFLFRDPTIFSVSFSALSVRDLCYLKRSCVDLQKHVCKAGNWWARNRKQSNFKDTMER